MGNDLHLHFLWGAGSPRVSWGSLPTPSTGCKVIKIQLEEPSQATLTAREISAYNTDRNTTHQDTNPVSLVLLPLPKMILTNHVGQFLEKFNGTPQRHPKNYLRISKPRIWNRSHIYCGMQLTWVCVSVCELLRIGGIFGCKFPILLTKPTGFYQALSHGFHEVLPHLPKACCRHCCITCKWPLNK